MFRVFTCLGGQHDWRLVLIAGAVCLLASYVAISLLQRARQTGGMAKAAWIAIAGTASGCGIWATHFIAMLAYDPGVAVSYDVALTVESLLVAAALTGLGLFVAVFGAAPWRAPVGGAIVGSGVACMHFLGMEALDLPGRINWSVDLIAASVLCGAVLATSALVVTEFGRGRAGRLSASGLFTLAILAHHFIAMGAIEIVPDPTVGFEGFNLSPMVLAIAIAGVSIAILGVSLISAIMDGRLAEQNFRLYTALDNMSQGLCMFDRDQKLIVCNEKYAEMFGLSVDLMKRGTLLSQILEHRIAKGVFAVDFDGESYKTERTQVAAQNRSSNSLMELRDGRVLSVAHEPTQEGGWVATFEDVTERKRAAERIAYLAKHDVLTDLPNRAAFTEELDRILRQAKSENAEFAVLCLDLDRFKDVNDVFGHSIGDTLLQQVTRRIQEAAPDVFLARLGGDEFMLIIDDLSDPSRATTLAKALLTTVGQEFNIEGHRLRVGVSIGIGLFPVDGNNATTLLGNADAALYRAKADGRGTFRFFEAEMDERLRERRALQHDLRSALGNGELSLHYQPQARVTGEIIGFEALVRWTHPERGPIPPSIFIPLAEESGLIIAIGEWVLREAAREAASWPVPLQIAVNLSPVQFRHGDLPTMVHTVLLETGLPTGRLELEITEGVLVDDFDLALSILRRLKMLGARIAMDDFGTGYSSLSYLQSFPFDKIKIDRGFVANLSSNPQSIAIIRAVIGLARGLSLPVIAEGVETEDQRAFLQLEGCDEVQGYLIGRPAPIAAYAHLIGRAAPAPAKRVAMH